ncbi:hypothetical protein TNCV_171761 [Trichonephila clavipes]|nr:hypothetical protein TNCV_171761 [Trichonephila clavipes]
MIPYHFQASNTVEVRLCREDGRFLADYVTRALIRPKGVLWDLDQGSEKASPVFEHPFRQTTSEQASMCEWSSYPAVKPRETPRYHYASTTKVNSRHNRVPKDTFTRHLPNPDASIRLPDCKARFITPKNSFPHVHSPMAVSSTPLQSMLRILWSDVWLVSGCTTMESQVF